MHINHPTLVAQRIAAVAHLQGVKIRSPAAAMVANAAYYLTGFASRGVSVAR